MFEVGSCSARLVKFLTRFPVLPTANLNGALFLEEKHQLTKSSAVNISGPHYINYKRLRPAKNWPEFSVIGVNK
jgi:hypothetical protein